MAKSDQARRRFMAALALYLVWVGALAAMAVTTGKKPPTHIVHPAAKEHSDPPAPTR